MPHDIILLGSEGQGKSTVAAALARDLGSKLPRNLFTSETPSTIELAANETKYALTDCPSHDDIRKYLSSGSTKFLTAILVVSVVDGVETRTSEHIELCKIHGVRRINTWLNKCDMIGAGDAEFIELVEEEIAELLGKHGYGAENIAIMRRGSALKALQGDLENVQAIRNLLG